MNTSCERLAALQSLAPVALVLGLGDVAQQAYLKATNTGPVDDFGRAVAVSGATLVIGAPLEDSGATGVNGGGGDDSELDSGAAYVFVREGDGWVPQAYLKASNTDAADGFGESVAISGDVIVIGATGEDSAATGVDGDESDDSAEQAGAAYVFVRSGATWTQEAYLKASNASQRDRFGSSVAVSGDTIVVGARREDSAATGVDGDQSDDSALQAGAAYVFVRNGATWTQQAYLKASNTDEDDWFGDAVAISGDVVVVGAPRERSAATGADGDESDDSLFRAGAAYVFVRNGTTWSQDAYLKASNTDPRDSFGISVAVSGETVVVGANEEESAATGIDGDQADDSVLLAGAAYVFVKVGGAWTQEAYVKASNTAVFGQADQFGGSVAISGARMVIGASGESSQATGVHGNEDDDGAPFSGAAYLFERGGAGWEQVAYMKASNTQEGDRFGTSVAIAGVIVVSGAPGESSSATGVNGDQGNDDALASGAAYELDPSTVLGTRFCSPAVPNSSGRPGRMAVLGSPVVTDDELVLRANGLPVVPGTLFNVGYFLMGTGTSTFTPPGSAGPICVTPGLRRFLPPVENTEELFGGFERAVGTSGPQSGAITAGSTWNFQAWHRDLTAGTSNFTDAVSVTFQ